LYTIIIIITNNNNNNNNNASTYVFRMAQQLALDYKLNQYQYENAGHDLLKATPSRPNSASYS